MKKMFSIISPVIFLMILTVSCRSAPPPVGISLGEGFPQFVIDAVERIPQDHFVSIRSAHRSDRNESIRIARERALIDLSFQVYTMVQAMETLVTVGTSDFFQYVSQALTASSFTGARIEAQGFDENSHYWMVLSLSSENVVSEGLSAITFALHQTPSVEIVLDEESMTLEPNDCPSDAELIVARLREIFENYIDIQREDSPQLTNQDN